MGSKDFSAFKNDTWTISLSIKDNASNPVDITGYAFFFTMKTNETDADANAILKKDVTSHITPASGLTAIVCTPTDTAISGGRYFYDIQMKDTGSAISTLVKGVVVVEQDITTRTIPL